MKHLRWISLGVFALAICTTQATFAQEADAPVAPEVDPGPTEQPDLNAYGCCGVYGYQGCASACGYSIYGYSGYPAYWTAGYLWAPYVDYYAPVFTYSSYAPFSPLGYPVYAYPPGYGGWGWAGYAPYYPYGYGYAGYGACGLAPVYLGW